MLVFVSYCRQDVALVKPLILQLGVLGHSVQFEAKMPGGQIRWKQVMASIKDSDVFIVALTDHALRSESRRLEMQYARRLGKRALAVRLTDLTGEIPPELAPILDYTVADKQSNLQLVLMLNKVALIGLVPPAVAVPDWRIPLLKMQTTIKAPVLSMLEQETIVSNLEEFLERRETLRAARSLLKAFARRKDLEPYIQDEIQLTSTQLRQSHAKQRRARLRNIAMGGMVLLMILVVPFFLVYRKARNDAAAQTAQAEASQVLIATMETTPDATDAIIIPTETTPDATEDSITPHETVTLTATGSLGTTINKVRATLPATLTDTLVPPAVFTAEDLPLPTPTPSPTMRASTESDFSSALTAVPPRHTPTTTAD